MSINNSGPVSFEGDSWATTSEYGTGTISAVNDSEMEGLSDNEEGKIDEYYSEMIGEHAARTFITRSTGTTRLNSLRTEINLGNSSDDQTSCVGATRSQGVTGLLAGIGSMTRDIISCVVERSTI